MVLCTNAYGVALAGWQTRMAQMSKKSPRRRFFGTIKSKTSMPILELNPNQIVTINDYPLYSKDVLVDYFNKCQQGEKLPLVPVIKKDIVVKYFDNKILELFKKFAESNLAVEYFMLDGSHRTTALTLAGRSIAVIAFEKDNDIVKAKKMVEIGKTCPDDVYDHTLEENCKTLNQYFIAKPYFMTVEQKAAKLVAEKLIPQSVIARV